MKKMMKWLLIAGCGIVVLILLVFIIGALLPARQTFTRRMQLKQTPDAVFSLLANVAELPQWTRSVKTVEMLPPEKGREVTRQTFRNGMVMIITTSESLRPSKLVRKMSDANGTFSGSWSYEFTPTDGGCRITVTEQVEFPSPPFRVLARVFGFTKYVDERLQDIAAKFGEPAVID